MTPHVPTVRLSCICILVLAVALAGCTAKKEERIEEGLVAAQRSAQADVKAQREAGANALSTPSSLPSLTGEGQVQVGAPPAGPATAPQGDKFDNDNAAHLLARCRDRAARQEWFDAVGDCRRSYELNPSSIEPQVELMRLLVTLQSYSEAEVSARKVLAVKPEDPVALYYLAWAHRGREEYPQAIAALKRALAADPKRVEYVQALGKTYCLADNFGKGIATLEQALAMRPGDEATRHAIASARQVLADKLAPYEHLVRQKPDSYDNQAALGFMYQKFGLQEKALAAYDTALQKIPQPYPAQQTDAKKLASQIYYNRGVLYHDLGRSEIAEQSLTQSMKLDPELAPVAWYYIGLCRADQNKVDASIEALQKSIELAPDVADNRAALADAYDKAGKKDLASEQRNAVAAIEKRQSDDKAARAKEETDLTNAAEASQAEQAAKAAAANPAPAPTAAPVDALAKPADASTAAPPEAGKPAGDGAPIP